VLGSAERKSVEPMASLASGDAATSRHMHDKLLPRCPLCHECRRLSTRLNCRAP
jgi:hypothetical protein